MNNRDYKIFAEGEVFHIYNRGVGKSDIFLDEKDYTFFLKRLKEALYPELMGTINFGAPDGPHQQPQKKQGTVYVRKPLPSNSFGFLAYVLMPNHFHFIIKQNTDVSISKLVSKVLTSYSKYFNKKYDRVGTLFQDSFKAINVNTDEYLRWLSAYVHNNPKTAGLVEDLRSYPWSSYVDYIGQRQGTLCQKKFIMDMFMDTTEYVEFVKDAYELIRERKDMEQLLLD